MFRSLVFRPIFSAIILGGIFAVALVSQVTHRNNPYQDTKPVRLTRSQVVDAVAVVSHFCDRLTVQSDWMPVQVTQDENAATNALVSDVCGQLGADAGWKLERLASDQPLGRDAHSITPISGFINQ